MLFNSYPFLLVFLPASLAGYFLLARTEAARLWFLVAISLVFYGWWDPRFVPLLVGGILVNWAAMAAYHRTRCRAILVTAIIANLLCLGVFKYANFAITTANGLVGTQWGPLDIALPIGISFFTFHHIIYLADGLAGRAPLYRLRDYALYIALFPQILAGPLVRHSELIHQLGPSPLRPGLAERWSRGLVLLVIGLVKKVLVADALATAADQSFASAAAGHALAFGEAWTAALAFTFQIYFDFSGYSDMAIGMALLFGLQLPINFDSPYRSLSLREFWRRWHMTLSRFLRDYLYIPLGGNRHGHIHNLGALVVTMLLGGLWHGAGWTFVIWGGLHGLGLALGRIWTRSGLALPAALAWTLTFLFVVIAWVFFRADTLNSAEAILAAMAGGSGAGWGLVHADTLRTIAVAAPIALIGPTSQRIALEQLRPRPWFAAAAATALLVALFRLNDQAGHEFIYFQF